MYTTWETLQKEFTLLENKMVEGCEKDWLRAVFKGNILKKADANQLVYSIIAAIEIFVQEKKTCICLSVIESKPYLLTYLLTQILF